MVFSSFGEMKLYGIHVALHLCLYIVIVSGCDFNDCICGNGLVICEKEDDSQPFFSQDEQIETVSLHITSNQKEWFKDHCDTFGRLHTVVFRDHTACPSHTCVPCL